MVRIPYLLRFSIRLRRSAIRRGIIGGDPVWRFVAVGVYAAPALRRFFGKQVEHIGTERLATGQFVKVSNIAPMTRRQRRGDRRALDRVRAQAIADVEASRSRS